MTLHASKHPAAWLGAFLLPLSILAAGVAVTNPPVIRWAHDGYTAEVLAHAYPDEYYYGVGDSRNDYHPEGINPFGLPAACTAKVNQAYVWGMGKSGNDIYFGTLANGDKLVEELYLNLDTNAATFAEVQEGTAGYYGTQYALTHGGTNTGDWRPPQLFRYNLASHSLTLLDPTLPAAAQANLLTIGGIRAGGAATANAYNKHQMVLLAGPPLDHTAGGVAFFLFDATTTNFIGTTINYNYNNIRRMVCVNGDLYFGVQKTNTLDGAVVRWVNNPKAKGYPFIFQEVGTLDEMGADICVHQGRLFCTTWPGYVEDSLDEITALLADPATLADIYRRTPGLWMSPVVPAAGLTTANRTQWQKVWSVANYEPDPMIALTVGGGALASFDGYLYFGTMQVPDTGYLAFQFLYGLPTGNNAQNYAITANTWRPLSLFRANNFRAPVVSTNGTITSLGGDFELLYGYTNLPAFTPAGTNIYAVTNWVSTPNRMGQTPSMGPSGFGYFYNTYTWSMGVFDNTLFVGTFCDTLPNISRRNDRFHPAATNNAAVYGGQLYCLHSSMASRFRPVSLNGLGNICNYGFRTMSSDSNGLYIGTANPRNLLPNPTNNPAYGGWELLKLTRRSAAPYDMDGDFESDAAWMTATGSTFVIVSTSGIVTNFAGATNTLAAWADYDNDGVADPAWCNPATGAWTVWLSSRNGQKTNLPVFAASGSVPVSADFDGDGKADLALCSTSSGKITWRSTLTGKIYNVAPAGGTVYLPAVGDYNGDGVAELVWYIPPNGLLPGMLVRSSSTTAAILTIQRLRGSFKGVPVPADYDGDGKTDFALHNPVTGVIRVWRSSDGAIVDSAAPGPGWLPMPGDYDGDGKVDFAWYNPISGLLRIQPSSTGVTEPDVDTVAVFGIPLGSRPVAAPAAIWYTK